MAVDVLKLVKANFNKKDMFTRSYWVQKYLSEKHMVSLSWLDEKEADKFYHWMSRTVINSMDLIDEK